MVRVAMIRKLRKMERRVMTTDPLSNGQSRSRGWVQPELDPLASGRRPPPSREMRAAELGGRGPSTSAAIARVSEVFWGRLSAGERFG
jgi:hypothetical protein